MPAPCPGPCNNAWRRAETTREQTGTEHHIQPSWGQPAQCWGCVDRTRQQLAELPELLTAIHLEALYGTTAKLTGTIGRAGTVSWPGQPARLLIDRIVGEMTELQTDILKLRNIWSSDFEPGPITSEGRHITGLVRTLDAHWDWAMQNHPAADESYDRENANPGGQVAGWYHAALRFTKQDEQRDVQRLAPCPRCEGPYLVESRDLRLVGDRPYIECKDPDCRRVMTGDEYDAYVKTLTGQVKAAA
ncbi:hypothetical protein AAW14_06410 [Streptomyces hygroscopicus]|uniref:hypothetical protein n=1 Tax=Streptomyces hygroscopicus TaxID=1912 RepID=UPI002240380F|nr:hypothetical protein [Streptomyces hygroscopicus]MCW7941672.1 hypothetical protein [Streptomyces hygroscopicus]